jgi:carboxyl-terminal processing protease
MKNRISWGVIALLLAALGLGAAGAMLPGCRHLGLPSSTIPAPARPDFELMAEAWNTIQRVYVDRRAVTPKHMTYGAISGMVDSLGDTGHSRFLTPEMVQQEANVIRGRLEGIGAEVQEKNNQVIIVAPMDGSPAQKAGLKPGDVILKVNGEEISGLPLEQAVSRILGPAGTPVQLTIFKPSTGETRQITLIRANITLQNVTWSLLPGTRILQLRIASFSRGVGHEVRKALASIQLQRLTGIILDLRNDPGGLFEEAVKVTSQFLDKGNVALERNAAGKVTPVPVKSGGLAPTIPLVVLVNEGTASAAEIVSGAIQDARRAKLVGEKTFGTGTVLEKFPLSDGSALLLATEEWLTPTGRLIWHRGISPNVLVPLPAGITPLFPDAEKGMTAKELQASRDEQLLEAINLLRRHPEARTHD